MTKHTDASCLQRPHLLLLESDTIIICSFDLSMLLSLLIVIKSILIAIHAGNVKLYIFMWLLVVTFTLKGERSFFLRPGELLESGIQDVYVLSEEEGLVLRAVESFMDTDAVRQTDNLKGGGRSHVLVQSKSIRVLRRTNKPIKSSLCFRAHTTALVRILTVCSPVAASATPAKTHNTHLQSPNHATFQKYRTSWLLSVTLLTRSKGHYLHKKLGQ